MKIAALFPSTETGHLPLFRGFTGCSDAKESTCNVGAPGSIPGSGRSLGGGNGNPLQYSCLENSMDRGAWQATVQGVTKELDMTKHAHTHTHTHTQRCAVWPIQPSPAHHRNSHRVLMMFPVLCPYSQSSPTSYMRLFPPTLIKKTQ